MLDEVLLWSGGTGHTMGAFSIQWMWQEYPHSVYRNITMKALIVKSKTLKYMYTGIPTVCVQKCYNEGTHSQSKTLKYMYMYNVIYR